ncbi:S49 family peptidase [Chloroflexota bacterium]
MPWLESTKRLLCRWFTSIPFFILLGLILGAALAIPAIPRPKIATIPISGPLLEQDFTDNIVKALISARDDNSVKAVILKIDSPGGYVITSEQIYLEARRLQQKKPVVTLVQTIAASGGYHVAVAADFIYAMPTSSVGSVGAFSSLPSPEILNEATLSTGLFKATGGSKRRAIAVLEMIRQQFVSVVMSHRGDRLKMSEEKLSQAELYTGTEALTYGLIDAIGTTTDAAKKAAEMAGIINYELVDVYIPRPLSFYLFFGSADLAQLKAQTGNVPVYYYLHFESE